MDERERTTEEIREDLAREEENLSRTAEKIGDRIKEKLDWGEYVKDSPYLALGIAAGVGFFAARALQPRRTPMQRIIGTLAEEVRGALGNLQVGESQPGLARLALLGIGTKLAADWIRKANSSGASDSVSPLSPEERDSYSPEN